MTNYRRKNLIDVIRFIFMVKANMWVQNPTVKNIEKIIKTRIIFPLIFYKNAKWFNYQHYSSETMLYNKNVNNYYNYHTFNEKVQITMIITR